MADPAPSSSRPAGAWRFLPAALAAAAALGFAGWLGPVSRGAAPEFVAPWAPALGVGFAFRLDGLALAFALLITGIGAICLLYAASYFRDDRRLGALLVTLSLFAVSMLGLVTADDAVTLFVFWEGTTITSWLLVGFDHERASARAAALQALLVTALGGLALFAGLLVMGEMAGTYRLSEMNGMGEMFRASPAYPAIFALVMLGCLTKSAQWPFQFWLPGAMAAPTPVSAYLHSATMVKAGVFLIARFSPALGGTELWVWTLTPVGGFTMLLASVWAMRQTDLKMMLAYTTLMALGAITMLLGAATPAATAAAMTFLIAHALYKAALFLAVGMIEKGAGARDYLRVGGLAPAMPLTAAVTALAAASMAGLPPLFGFIAKESGYQAAEHAPILGAAATAGALAANAMMVACAGLAALRPFFGARRSPHDRPADPGPGLWLGPSILAVLGLSFGLAPFAAERYLVAPMALAASGVPMPEHLALWHGVNRPLILSLVTFALGFALYAAIDRIRDGLAAAEPALPRTEGWYDAALAGALALARGLTRRVQNGRMTSYLRLTFLAFGALIWGAILAGDDLRWPSLAIRLDLLDSAIVVLIVASVIVVLRATSRLVAITALGGVGAAIAIVFVLYGAVDVAMTQLFVEILVVVFLAIAMVRLPPSGAAAFRPGDAAVAAFLGLGVAAAALAVLGTDLDLRLTAFFEAASYPQAFGRNVVNVILVDFRGFDTMGEISVIVIAGVAAVAALLAGRRAAR